jgi:hypothetical protein
MVPLSRRERPHTLISIPGHAQIRCGRKPTASRPPNGLELSRPAARAAAHPLSRILEGQASSTFRLNHASRVNFAAGTANA